VDAEAHVPIRSVHDLVPARAKGRALALELGFSRTDATLIATAISEVARNIVVHARQGELVMSAVIGHGRRGLTVRAIDNGPGIRDIDAAVTDGWATRGGLGLGLPGARRLMDEFDIESVLRRGTTVTMSKWLDPTQRAAHTLPQHDRGTLGGRLADWALAGRPRSGEHVSGDNGVAVPTTRGTFAAVVDGLGHGPAAAAAARLAIRVLEARAEEDLPTIMGACHDALKDSRGAAISIAAIAPAENTLTWLGVGNVAGRLCGGPPTRRHLSLPLLDGIVGSSLPRLEPTTVKIERGDVLLVSTDGVASEHLDPTRLVGAVAQIAADLLADASGTRNDDAMVLVLRYLGGPR
jgi:anti-sigma regulatory factor (Ser/Thr protein kinase)